MSASGHLPPPAISPGDVSVIVPVSGAAPVWNRCWRALDRLDPAPREIIAVFDGPGVDRGDQASGVGARVVVLDRQGGPAMARNRGSEVASGEILLFIDADVEAPPGLVAGVAESFNCSSELAAVIGSYDDAPGDPGFLSQYRNLLHHFVHQHGRADASTFWGACGAVRRSVFLELGGFDESYSVPSIEDIELGSRLCQSGHSIRLVKNLQVKHLKRWRLVNMLATDLFGRAVPWTRLILRDRHMINDLNVRTRDRVSVLAAWMLLLSLATACLWLPLLAVSAVSGLVLATLNAALVGFFISKRGALFALASLFWYWIYLLLCGIGFGLGTARHLMGSRQ